MINAPAVHNVWPNQSATRRPSVSAIQPIGYAIRKRLTFCRLAAREHGPSGLCGASGV